LCFLFINTLESHSLITKTPKENLHYNLKTST
jgi:hypothetical protein